ncbi:hypothetical protein LJC56_07185 [Christensenellaceae bacterium OttesenSCG-928-K19]|nr:hypothetical protein [Christensenellaceae bacterium OttesenSCG-928-K19]
MGAQTNGKTVTLRDLYDLFKRQKEPEAKELATCLELYVIGSLDGFAKPSIAGKLYTFSKELADNSDSVMEDSLVR